MARGGTWGGKGREEPTRWGREGGRGDREKRRGERRTREDGGNLSVTRRASGNERTPGNVYVLHKEGPPCVPLRSRARARARTRALVPLASRAAPRRATSSPLRPPPYVSNPSRTYDATRPMYNASQKSRVACSTCLPACLRACLVWLSACLPAMVRFACSLACVRLSAPPACLRCSASLRSRFARENRSLLKYIGEYEERPRRALPGEALAGKWL